MKQNSYLGLRLHYWEYGVLERRATKAIKEINENQKKGKRIIMRGHQSCYEFREIQVITASFYLGDLVRNLFRELSGELARKIIIISWSPLAMGLKM